MSRPTRESAAGRAYLDLQNQARRQKRGTQELLTMYIVERWLSRMSRSPYAEDFILKGGMLLASFGTRRPTVDADALARNMASDQETVARRVAEIAAIEDPDDGVEFLSDTVTTAVIRDDALYSGVRVTMTAQLATAQVKLRLDINFGDPVTCQRPVGIAHRRPAEVPAGGQWNCPFAARSSAHRVVVALAA
ncbi:nucleotidyl transferase AbiEii/AbiGii toxin family protein [Microbacterium aurum]